MALKVLLVDDDANIAECIQTILERSNLDVEFSHVSSGMECLDILRTGFQGFIMMDVMMPEMSGWDTLHEMLKDGFCDNNLISMFTSVSDPPASSDDLAAYVFNYIRKPSSTSEILGAVSEAMMMCPAC